MRFSIAGWLARRGLGQAERFVARLRNHENDPETAALLRRAIGIGREQTWAVHEFMERLFVAEDVGGVTQCLVDVSDKATIRWLVQSHPALLAPRPGRRPLVIDLGANDGFIGSMSLNFVQLGWNAVLVEPLPAMMALARANLERYRRPEQRLVFVEAAIGASAGELHFETAAPGDLSQMEGRLVAAPSRTSRLVTAITADGLLARPDVAELVSAAGPIVLSVDIEGQDLVVTERLLALGLRPDVVLFETIRAEPEALGFFAEHGYRRAAHIGWNDVYLLPDPALGGLEG
jgi:FkbM family methyltransferase